jgi:nitroimidazol reductase NimA-like FMN-containing flavoprotein (pyridoxamine 5'-phosphate oxidase superfamily)
MRRSDRQMSKEDALAILGRGSYGILSTAGENGYPSGTPFNYADDGENVYLHFAAGSVYKSVAKEPRVGFTVVGRSEVVPQDFATNYESVMLHGMAEELHGKEKYAALHLLVKKFSPQFEESGIEHIDEDIDNCHVLKIRIEHITGKTRKG